MLERLLISLALIAVLVLAYQLLQARHRTRIETAGDHLAYEGALQPALLYFWSENCVPCVTQARFLQQLPEEVTRQVRIERIDAEKERETATRYGVFTLPTTMLVDRQGSVRHVNYGLADAGRLTSQMESIL